MCGRIYAPIGTCTYSARCVARAPRDIGAFVVFHTSCAFDPKLLCCAQMNRRLPDQQYHPFAYFHEKDTPHPTSVIW